MELRQLEYFTAVAEEGSFTRASARVHVAQPGVSAQVRRLERELGHDLLDRSGRTVTLTEVGTAVLPHARAALDAVAAVRLAVDELAGLVRGHVAVGTVTSHDLRLADLLADFHRVHPGVEITLAEGGSDDLLAGLRDGRFDLAVAALAGEPPPGVAARTLTDEAVFAAVAPGDPLAARDTITLAALVRRELISLPPGAGLRAILDGACATAGLQPRIAFEASHPAVLAQLAARGLGVAVLPESLARGRPDDLHPLAITRPSLRGRLVLAWRADGPVSPAAHALVTLARRDLY
jgi:DNA-binding transcriptional LysR family regulator